MAKKIDKNRLLNIREAAIDLITGKGYAATSIQDIADQANVATGYLYRHYPSKEALIKNIYEEKLNDFHDGIFHSLKEAATVADVINALVQKLAAMIENEPEVFRFLFIMLHDHHFEIPDAKQVAIRIICKRILNIGKLTGEIPLDLDPEIIYYTLFSMPFSFFDARLRKIFIEKNVTPIDLETLKNICLSALANNVAISHTVKRISPNSRPFR